MLWTTFNAIYSMPKMPWEIGFGKKNKVMTNKNKKIKFFQMKAISLKGSNSLICLAEMLQFGSR